MSKSSPVEGAIGDGNRRNHRRVKSGETADNAASKQAGLKKVKMSTWLDGSLHRDLKRQALDDGQDVSIIVRRLCDLYVNDEDLRLKVQRYFAEIDSLRK